MTYRQTFNIAVICNLLARRLFVGHSAICARAGRRSRHMPRFHDVYLELAAQRAKHKRDRSAGRSKAPDLSTKPGYASLSDGFAPVIDNRAKTLADRFRGETKATADAIQSKANRVRILVSKSAYQYATETDDPASAHRKGG